MKSIMHEKDGTCYLCIKLEGNYRLQQVEEHHVVFGTANRRKSEKYGLKVYLCHRHHEHDGGAFAVHRNKDVRNFLCEQAQRTFERKYPDLSFLAEFGRNYLVETEEKPINTQSDDGSGFIFLEEGI